MNHPIKIEMMKVHVKDALVWEQTRFVCLGFFLNEILLCICSYRTWLFVCLCYCPVIKALFLCFEYSSCGCRDFVSRFYTPYPFFRIILDNILLSVVIIRRNTNINFYHLILSLKLVNPRMPVINNLPGINYIILIMWDA